MTIMDESINPEKLLEHSGWMKALALSLVADEEAAQDVVQKTYLAALKTPPRSFEAVGAWLRKVVRNFALRTRQEDRHRRKRELRAARPEKVTSTPAELLQRVELQYEIAYAITQLEEPYRSVVLLRYFEELSVTAIARRHGIPVTTVSSRLARALDQLRVRLDRKYGGSRLAWSLILLPLARSKEAAAAAAATSTAIPGTLLLKGVAMKATIKVAAILTPIIVAGALLIVGGIIPESLMFWGSGEEPLEVSFRPIIEAQENSHAPVAEIEATASEVMVTRERLVPTEPSAVADAPVRAVIKAKIVDQNGHPLKGARLHEVTIEGPEASAISDRSGLVELTLDASEKGRGAHVEACLAGYVSHVEKLWAFAGRTINLGTIELLPGGAVRGYVHDGEGRCIAGAVITADKPDEYSSTLESKRFWEFQISIPAVRTDDYGAFVLTGLSAGFVRLWARAEGWLPNYTAPIEIQEGQETFGVEIAMQPLGPENQIRGRVVDPDGASIPFAKLHFGIHSDGIGYTRIHVGKTKEDGTFKFLVAEGTYMTFTAIDPKGRYGAASAERVDAGELDLELRLKADQRIHLVALGANRKQIERFKFEVLTVDEELILQEGWSGGDPREIDAGDSGVGKSGCAGSGASSGDTDADSGIFYRLPGEDYFVRVIAPLHQIRKVGPFRPGEIDDLLEVHLYPLPGIHGTVLADDKPVKNAQVRLHKLVPDDKSVLRSGFACWLHPIAIEEVRTDAKGRFVLTPRKAGRHVVRVEVKGFAPAEYGPVNLDPMVALDPVVIELGQGGIIEGRVIPPLGQDPTGTVVAINRGDGRPRNVRVGPEGTFRFTHLIPGLWCVEKRDEEIWQVSIRTGPKRDEGEKEIDYNCEVDEGKTTFIDLYIDDPDAFSLSGVMTLDGKPLVGWLAWLCPPDSFFFENIDKWPKVTLDPHGRFELPAAKSGYYKLVIKHASREMEKIFANDVFIGSKHTPWSLDVITGTLVIEGLKALTEDQDMPELVYGCEGEVWFGCLIIPDENGVCRLTDVPVGKGKLLRPSMETMDFTKWEVAAEVMIARGKETRITAP